MRKKEVGFLRWILLVPREHCQEKLWEAWRLVSKQDHRENGRSLLFYKIPNPSTCLVDFQPYLGFSNSEHMQLFLSLPQGLVFPCGLILFVLNFILRSWVFCLHDYLSTMCMYVLTMVKGGHWVLQEWSYKCF